MEKNYREKNKFIDYQANSKLIKVPLWVPAGFPKGIFFELIIRNVANSGVVSQY